MLESICKPSHMIVHLSDVIDVCGFVRLIDIHLVTLLRLLEVLME